MNTEILAYLDHNILDPMRKGDPYGVKSLLKENSITPIYSNETIKEIKRSVGSEEQFLTLLKDIGAKYIEPVMENNLPTGTANIHNVNPFDVYNHYLENEEPLPEYGYGLSAMLEKFYGGREDETYDEVFSNGSDELQKLLNDALNEISETDEIDDEIQSQLHLLPGILKEQWKLISKEMDKEKLAPLKQFEEATQLGAIVFNNIEPPNVVRKIFELVAEAMSDTDLDIDVFFGIKYQPFEPNSDREKTLAEKVNAIYHQLNFLGYYRDSGMKNSRGFVRSSSDMTHAGVAAFCHLFFCRDKGLVKKSAAAYEYLGIKTKIVYFQANNTSQPTPKSGAAEL